VCVCVCVCVHHSFVALLGLQLVLPCVFARVLLRSSDTPTTNGKRRTRHAKNVYTYCHVAQGKEPEYLDYNIKGRGFWERMPYNAGALYITGEGAE